MKRNLITCAVGLLIAGVSLVNAQMPGRRPPSQPAKQIKFHVDVPGIDAVQVAWWFQHMASKDGQYWTALSPANEHIHWNVDPADDAHQIIGAVFTADQKVDPSAFPGGHLRTQAQFADYITQPRDGVPGQPAPLSPAVSFPREYNAPHPSPIIPPGRPEMAPVISAEANGFNEDLLLFDGHGFCPGRILFSWINSGDDDTPATKGKPRSISMDVTFYLPFMEHGNRPPELKEDGYFYTEQQVKAIWAVWESNFKGMTEHLPAYWNAGSQDDLARKNGFTVVTLIDTGTTDGLTAKMENWWWNHGMGDDPGNAYVFWCPPAHHTIRWLPGYSPSEVLKGAPVPEDHIVAGMIYPDLQGSNLEQDGGGMMSYPPSMSPIPGAYQIVDPMMILSKEQVDNLDKVRFPPQDHYLVHQWGDTPGGLIHRSTVVSKLPLRSPVNQGEFVADHQNMEGLFLSTGKLAMLYSDWQKKQH